MSKLDGSLQKQLYLALIKALPTKGHWQRMANYELHVSLDEISTSGTIDDIAFEVIRWAISRGREEDLVSAARRQNATNPELLQFYHKVWLPFVDADTKLRQTPQIPICVDTSAALSSADGYLDMNAPSSILLTARNNRVSETLAKLDDLKNGELTINLKEISSARNLSFHSLMRDDGPIAIYYSYADEDVGLLTLLQRQLVMLNRSGLITVWHRGMIQEGEDEYTEQVRHLNSAHIILLFVSPHFLASEHTYREAVRAMQRLETEGTVVIPIIWRPTADWQHAPFGGLRALPRTEKALTEYSGAGREKLVKEIATVIRSVVEELREKQF